METPKIHIILGSTRKNREGEKVAKWIHEQALLRKDFKTELIDLRDWKLPFFDEPMSPAMSKGKYTNDIATKWAKKVGEADGYIIVTPEYNHSFPAILKNALDYVYAEWNNKPVGFISYSGGPAAAVRAVEQLRLVTIELQMAPIRDAIHIAGVWGVFNDVGDINEQNYNDRAAKFFDQLMWWTHALKTARLKSKV